MPPDPIIPFSPPAAKIPAILADLRRDDLSFSALARLHNTSPDALSLWLASPEVAKLLESTDSMVCYRTRLIAAEHVPIALSACVQILKDFNASHAPRATDRGSERSVCLGPSESQPSPRSSDSLRELVLRHRIAETARKAAAIVTRLSRLPRTPGPNWDPAAKQRTNPANPASVEASPPTRSTASAAIPNPKSEIPNGLAELSLQAALQIAVETDPTRAPLTVLLELVAEQEAAKAGKLKTPKSLGHKPEVPAKNSQTPPRPPAHPRPPLLPQRDLWRHNTPGAAHPRAP